MTNPAGEAHNDVDYERYAEDFPHLFGNVEFFDIEYRAIAESSGDYVDLGAGDGSHLRAAIDNGMLEKFTRLIGIELSRERVARIARFVPEAEALAGDALAIPLPDSSMDFVFSDQVIEHVPDDVAMAREIARVLKPGAKALVGSVLKGRFGWYWRRRNGQYCLDLTHEREYRSVAQYEAVFSKAGLSVVESEAIPLRYSGTSIIMRLLILLCHKHGRSAILDA